MFLLMVEVKVYIKTEKKVKSAINMGTYNYGTNTLSHVALDMIPYYIWGNSSKDTSSVWDRVVSSNAKSFGYMLTGR